MESNRAANIRNQFVARRPVSACQYVKLVIGDGCRPYRDTKNSVVVGSAASADGRVLVSYIIEVP